MKTLAITLFALALSAGSRAENLSTVDGTTYHQITFQRTDPDGLYIEYAPVAGSLGMAKVKFSRLSPEQQKQFGYDPAKAREFEAQCALATAICHEQAIQWDEAARKSREERASRELEEQKTQNEFALAMAQQRAAETANYGAGYGGAYLGGGYSLVAVPALHGTLRTFHGGLEVVPNQGPRRSTGGHSFPAR